LNWLKQ